MSISAYTSIITLNMNGLNKLTSYNVDRDVSSERIEMYIFI